MVLRLMVKVVIEVATTATTRHSILSICAERCTTNGFWHSGSPLERFAIVIGWHDA